MKPDYFDELQAAFPQLILRNELSYREITTLGVGGTLPLLAEPRDDRELGKLLEWTHARAVPILVIGGGTNLVGCDAPTPALGIRLAQPPFSQVKAGRTHLTAGAFLRLPKLASAAAELGYGGVAPLAGIPGTLGGALRMNAGANGITIGEFVLQLCGFRIDGTPWTAEKEELQWGYRQTNIPEDVILTAAILTLPPSDKEKEEAAIRRELEARRGREPGGRSAGCTFRNISEFEPAGKLIEQCGFKEYRLGGVEVSAAHANYIVNVDSGTERDYLELLREIRTAVAEKFGFYLRPEVKFIDPAALETVLAAPLPPKVNVLKGGTSREREISLKSGAAVAQALRNAGFDVTETDLQECHVTPEMRAADVVYPVLHGGFGEDGSIQREMEDAGLKFVGSGSGSCLLVMDKIATKQLAGKLGIPTAKWHTVTPESREFPADLKLPVILKVPKEGSTFGIVRVTSLDEWEKALEEEFKQANEILVEEYLNGVEITVPIVGGTVLEPIEIRSPHGFYDYDAKYVYQQGHTEYFCPVQSLAEPVVRRAMELSKKFYLGARCRDILRVDFIVTPDGTPWLLEGNAIPGCTATSLVPKSARQAGISFEAMTASLVYAAMKRPSLNASAAVAAAGEETAPAEQEMPLHRRPSRLLLKTCRWLFRLVLLCIALPMLLVGVGAIQEALPEGFILLFSGFFVLGAEWIFNWFNKLEKL